MRLRRHALSRLCALSFIFLILVPFTAPFPTYDLGESDGHPFNVVPKEIRDKIDSDDQIALPPHWLLIPAAQNIVISTKDTRASQLDEHPVPHTILRL